MRVCVQERRTGLLTDVIAVTFVVPISETSLIDIANDRLRTAAEEKREEKADG